MTQSTKANINFVSCSGVSISREKLFIFYLR